MRYEGDIYRPPSEAYSYILQATIGCSWNLCTYCDMYRAKSYRLRDLDECIEDIDFAAAKEARSITKMFVADGDALIMDIERWEAILQHAAARFPRLRRVSCYATATNILGKSPSELSRLRDLGLGMLYIGPESGDELTLKRLVKGAGFDDHAEAARLAREAGMKISVIFLLGAGGVDRSEEHAVESARLATAMDPEFLSCLTLNVIPGTPIARMEEKAKFELPDVVGLLSELRVFIGQARPSAAIFRSNHASNHLPIGGNLPRDRQAILDAIDGALAGTVGLRPEWLRGL